MLGLSPETPFVLDLKLSEIEINALRMVVLGHPQISEIDKQIVAGLLENPRIIEKLKTVGITKPKPSDLLISS